MLIERLVFTSAISQTKKALYVRGTPSLREMGFVVLIILSWVCRRAYHADSNLAVAHGDDGVLFRKKNEIGNGVCVVAIVVVSRELFLAETSRLMGFENFKSWL